MRLFTRLTLAGALALGLTVAACGDDSSSSGGTATAGTTAGETTEGGTTETATTESGTTEGETTEGGTTEAGTTAGETTEGGTTEGGTTAGETTEGGTTEAGTTEGGTTGMANMCDPGSSMDGAECALPTEFPGDLVHMTEMSFLKDPSQYNCDANGDGAIDKNDGSLNDFLTGDLLSAFADVNATFADSIMDGTLIFLVQMEGYKTGDHDCADVSMYIGTDIESQPDPTCGVGDNVMASCDWVVDEDSFADGCNPMVSMKDTQNNEGVLSGGPTDLSITFPIEGIPLSLAVTGGKFTGTATADGNLTGGRICGTVQKSDIVSALESACAAPSPPELCEQVASFGGIGLVGNLITCTDCTLVIAAEGVPASSFSLPAAQ